MKKALLMSLCLFLLCGCTSKNNDLDKTVEEDNKNVIVLENNSASFNSKEVPIYDYVWHINTNNEDEYFTGTKPNEDDSVYIAHDIVYYPEVSEDSFSLENYDGEQEWVTHYTSEELSDYIFATLPKLGNELPSEMMHNEKEAYNNPVLHITKAGEYELQGNFNGQILIDLGEEAFDDESQKVTIILNNANVTCSVAPAIIFYSVYEADNTWEQKETYDNKVDISNAGARVIIKDGTENNFTGANVYRLLKPKYKKEGSTVQKKRYKTDGAFYSYQSLLIEGENNGTGILNITSTTFEGLDSELHLQINSGNINIVTADDGINVNEDDVSVFIMNGGRLTIFAGQGAEGDVIDSNGFIVVNGGTILGTTPSVSDDMFDSETGVEVSENATVITGGSINSNNRNGFGPGMMPNKRREDFDPRNFENMPTPPNGQQPPTKPNSN